MMSLLNSEKKRKVRIGVVAICLFGMISLSSCNRGYGCPGDNLSVKVQKTVQLVLKGF